MFANRQGSERGSATRSRARATVFWIGATFSQVAVVLVVTPLIIVWTSTYMSHRHGEASNHTEDSNITDSSSAGEDGDSDGDGTGLEAVWTGGPATFHWHPLLMTIAFIPIMMQGLIAYRFHSRLFSCLKNKQRLKVFHALCFSLTFLLMAIGLSAAIVSHPSSPGHFTSLHSWLGLTTVFGFTAQLAYGLVVYMIPDCASEKVRRMSLHYHRLCGMALFSLACATILMGIVEVLAHAGASYPDSTQAVIGQLTGLPLPFVAVTILFLLTKSDYRRRQEADEMPLVRKRHGYQTAAVSDKSTKLEMSPSSSTPLTDTEQ